ncbi:MAG: hypothetical protein H0T90_08845 [Gemmatimonadales bacterium]|nr:hypothetical protein [Gemmatimonadales bacterium]
MASGPGDPRIGVIRAAIERLTLYFEAEQTRQGLLARAALGRSAPGDPALSLRLAGELSAAIRPDGSVGAAALPTIWRAHELMDLGLPASAPPLVRVMTWLLGLQGRPGAFGQGCERVRHAHRTCEHFVGGFFAPAPPEQRLAPVTLPSGKVFRAEPAARFATSCFALRAALRAGQVTQPVQQHLLSLSALAAHWSDWSGYFAPDMVISGFHALALAGPEHRGTVDHLVDFIAAHQNEDGGWPNTDFFHVLDALNAVGADSALSATQRAIPALVARQREDGAFGSNARQERALIGLRALLRAAP